jgi:hypothetical protein
MNAKQLVVASIVATTLYFSFVVPSPAAGPRSPCTLPSLEGLGGTTISRRTSSETQVDSG